MTTDNTNEAAKIAGTLSAEEWAALESFSHGNEIEYRLQNILEQKGLLCAADIADDELTPLGRKTLAAHVSVKAPERVTEITAAEFVEQGFAEKVKRGECTVWVGTWLKVESCVKSGAIYDTFLVDVSEYRQDKIRYFYADQKFDVRYPSEFELALRSATQPPAQPATESNRKLWGVFNPVTISAPAIDEWATKQPASATADGSGADDSSKRSEVEILIRANKRFDAIRLVHNKYDESIDDSRAYVNRVGAELSLQQTVDVSKMTLDTLQAELTTLRAQLQAAEDTIKHQGEVYAQEIVDHQTTRSRLQAAEDTVRGLREALEPFVDQMKWFEALAKTEGRNTPVHLDDKPLSTFQHTSLTWLPSPMNVLRVKHFRQAAAALEALEAAQANDDGKPGAG